MPQWQGLGGGGMDSVITSKNTMVNMSAREMARGVDLNRALGATCHI